MVDVVEQIRDGTLEENDPGNALGYVRLRHDIAALPAQT